VRHALAIVVGTIIGSGIFLVPTEMMQAVGSARLVYLAWLAGGEYVYIRDGYGPMACGARSVTRMVGFSATGAWLAIILPGYRQGAGASPSGPIPERGF
jgi:hypothetical protein